LKTKVISPTGRISFAKIAEPMEVPYLLDLQIDSFDWLVGNDAWRDRVATALDRGRTDINTKSGLEEIFEEISPIEDFSAKTEPEEKVRSPDRPIPARALGTHAEQATPRAEVLWACEIRVFVGETSHELRG
jgi:DNA-directed RNA polymerase beta subunit